MLISGYVQPIPNLQPNIPAAVEAAAAMDIRIASTSQQPQVISFYKPWDPYGALSNFSPHPISLADENGVSVPWKSVEHYYQVKKLSNPQGLLSSENTLPPQLHCEDNSF